MEGKQEEALWDKITAMMIELGIPAHLRGYYYLREGIWLTAQDLELVGSVTKLLYPEIAKKYKCSSTKVERAIRNSIEVSWQRGNTKYWEELFGYSRENGKKRPTNSEYIVVLADQIQRQMK